MQFKNKLLGSAIASVAMLSIIGVASAATFTTTVSTVGVTNTTPLPFANEVVFTADAVVGDDADDGGAVIAVDRSGGTFPSGNLVLRLTLTGATFDGAMNAGSVAFDANCLLGGVATSILSTGGADGTTSVVYVLSNLDSCDNVADGFTVTLPFDLDGATAASLAMTLETESGGVPVDNINASNINLVSSVSGYTPDIDTTGYTAVVADVAAVLGPYRNFFGLSPETIGDVEVAVRTGAAIDLNGGLAPTFASTADIADVTVSVTGDMSAYVNASAAVGVFIAGGTKATIAGSTATKAFGATGGVVAHPSAAGDLHQSDELVELRTSATQTVQIQASPYSATIALDLVTGFNDESLVANILPVTRNGTNATLPWTASSTQAAGTGSQNFVRVANPTAAAYGPIFATVLSSTVPARVGATATLAPSLAGGAEIVFTAAQLQTALGDFGRADIQIVVEGNGAIVKRLVQRTDGTYEINNVGVVGANAN